LIAGVHSSTGKWVLMNTSIYPADCTVWIAFL
jgi:hypothetical protein